MGYDWQLRKYCVIFAGTHLRAMAGRSTENIEARPPIHAGPPLAQRRCNVQALNLITRNVDKSGKATKQHR